VWSNNTDFGVRIGGDGNGGSENGGPNFATSQKVENARPDNAGKNGQQLRF